jgi:hypothetical protein
MDQDQKPGASGDRAGDVDRLEQATSGGPPMTLGNCAAGGAHHSNWVSDSPRAVLCHALSRALIGWFELASFDFCLGQHSIGTRKAQVPFAILRITHFRRALLILLRFRQICPCFWCHCSLIHSPMDLD